MLEYEKMLSGELYNSNERSLVEKRMNCRKILTQFNSSLDKTPENVLKFVETLTNQKLKNVFIQAPFYCDYGTNIELGENVYLNFNCTILDCAKVKIGKNTLIGPNVQIYTPLHPVDAQERITFLEYAKPITIGKNCWIGGNVTILPDVTIGDNVVIGAGSVVTKNIPSNTMAFGNPCKIVKSI